MLPSFYPDRLSFARILCLSWWGDAMKKFLFALLSAVRVTTSAAWRSRTRVMFPCDNGITQREDRSPDEAKGLRLNHRRFTPHLDFRQGHCQVI